MPKGARGPSVLNSPRDVLAAGGAGPSLPPAQISSQSLEVTLRPRWSWAEGAGLSSVSLTPVQQGVCLRH